MSFRPLFIFDLDGTLADIRHRRHLVEGETKDWRGFFAACVDDAPMTSVIRTLQELRSAACDVWVWSGRSDEVREDTMRWIERHGVIDGRTKRFQIRMRPAGDHQPDEKLKATWLESLAQCDRRRLVAIFEDRDRMVKLWRDNGIQCYQVAPGDF